MPTDQSTLPVAHSDDVYASRLIDFVTASPTSYHAAAETGARLGAVGFVPADETRPWDEGPPRRGYIVRDGAVVAWILPERLRDEAGWRIVGAHTDSPALKLKPSAAIVRDGLQVLDVEIYGGPLLNSFLDRELGLAGRLVTRDGRTRLVRTGPLARVVQVAPHLDRGVNDSLHLDEQAHLLPVWAPASADARPDDPERYLCELAGIDPADLAFHDILTFPTERPARFGRRDEFLASSRLDNLSSVHAALVALETLVRDGGRGAGGVERAAEAGPVVFIANDHEEVGSATRSGAAGPLLKTILERLAGTLGVDGGARAAMLARSVCVSADAGHAVHPNYPHLHALRHRRRRRRRVASGLRRRGRARAELRVQQRRPLRDDYRSHHRLPAGDHHRRRRAAAAVHALPAGDVRRRRRPSLVPGHAGLLARGVNGGLPERRSLMSQPLNFSV